MINAMMYVTQNQARNIKFLAFSYVYNDIMDCSFRKLYTLSKSFRRACT